MILACISHNEEDCNSCKKLIQPTDVAEEGQQRSHFSLLHFHFLTKEEVILRQDTFFLPMEGPLNIKWTITNIKQVKLSFCSDQVENIVL